MISKIAIIIPSLNSPVIDQVITAINQQEQVNIPWEIIVVGKDKYDLLSQFNDIKFINTKESVLAAVARNKGIEATNADLLVFLDSDCIPTSTWLASHLSAHQAGHQVVSGSVLPKGENYWHLAYNLTLFHEITDINQPGPRDFLATLNLSVARSIINKVGGMDETVSRVEDVEWTTRMRRAGVQPYYWPAPVYHLHSRTNLKAVWYDCALSGYYMRQLRLQYNDLLDAPKLLHYPKLVLTLSPIIAAWTTLKILRKRYWLVRRFPFTIPAIYITKIAWCWGASRSYRPS